MPPSASQSEIDSLVLAWHERFHAGEDLPLEAVCQERPELLPAVRAEVARIKQIEGALVQTWDSPTPTPSGTSHSAETLLTLTQFLKKPGQTPEELGWLAGMRIVRLLGHGGMGAVFLAEDTVARRQVALKILRPDRADTENARKRFVREARAAAAITDDHVMPIFQVGEADGVQFIVMPYLAGETLADRLARGPLSLPELLSTGRHVALGLSAAHKLGIIHRDLKPSNVWLQRLDDDDELLWRARLLDFGLARVTQELERFTASGFTLGTPRYIAPEQASDSRVDHRADLFSLGVVLFECATGKAPFVRRTIVDLLDAIVGEPADPAPLRQAGLPERLIALILRLLEKDAAARPKSAAEVAAELRSISKA